jgi:hypothetical protein
MKHASIAPILAVVLPSIAALSACTGKASDSTVATASSEDMEFGLQAGESLYEMTPAERRLEWVRRPARSQTADARLASESPSAKTR